MDRMPRTNNSVEGWHNAFSHGIGNPHQSFVVFFAKGTVTSGGNLCKVGKRKCKGLFKIECRTRKKNL